MLTVLASAALLLGTATVAVADHEHGTVTLTAEPHEKQSYGYILKARVYTTAGKPVNETSIRFYEVVDLLGPREMLIGAAPTDGQGVASLIYLPARLGPTEIVARFPGMTHITFAESKLTLRAAVAAAPYRVEALPLGSFTAAIPNVVAVLVLAVWGVIGFALLGTARGIAQGAVPVTSAQKREDPA